MKTLLFSMIAAIVIWSCNSGTAAATPKPGETTTMQWIDSVKKTVDPVKEGQVVNIAFRFKNTGSNPLIINKVVASCGCTVAEKPEAAIAPGKEGEIKASFNSQGRPGTNIKTLTVDANTNSGETQKLEFTVEVIPAADNK